MAAKELSAVKVAGAPGAYFGNITAFGFAVCCIILTLSFGGFISATVPFVVSSDRVLKTEPETRRWRMSIELFFKLMGLVQGVISNVAGDINVNSSENKRQPEKAIAAHNVLFPEPGGAGSIIT